MRHDQQGRCCWPVVRLPLSLLLLLLSALCAVGMVRLPTASASMSRSADGFGLDCSSLPGQLDPRFVTIPIQVAAVFPAGNGVSRTLSITLLDTTANEPFNILGSLSTSLSSSQFAAPNSSQLFRYVLPLYIVLHPGQAVGALQWQCSLLAGSATIVNSTQTAVNVSALATVKLAVYFGLNTSTAVFDNTSLSVGSLPWYWVWIAPMLVVGTGNSSVTVWAPFGSAIGNAAERMVMDYRVWPADATQYATLLPMYNNVAVQYIDTHTITLMLMGYVPPEYTESTCPDVLAMGTTALSGRVAEGDILPLDDYFVQLNNEGGQDIVTDIPQFFFYLLNTNLDPTDSSYHWYGVPIYVDIRYIVFNRTTFDTLQLKYPPPLGDWTNLDGSSAWTWQAFAETARAITDSGLGWGYTENPQGVTGVDEDENLTPIRQEVGRNLYTPYTDRPNFGTCALRNDSLFYNILDATLMKMFRVDRSGYQDLYNWTAWQDMLANGTSAAIVNGPPPLPVSSSAFGVGMTFDNGGGVSTSNLYDGVNNPWNPLSMALAPGKHSFLGGTIGTVTKCTRFPDTAWLFLTYLTSPSRPFSSMLGSTSLPAFQSVLSQPYWQKSVPTQILAKQLNKGVPDNFPQSPFLQEDDLTNTRHPWRLLLGNMIYTNMSLYENIQQFCDIIDQVFQPECASQDLLWDVGSECDPSSLTRSVSYSWAILCEETAAYPLPPTGSIGCLTVPSDSSAAHTAWGLTMVVMILSLLPALATVSLPWMAAHTKVVQRLLTGSGNAPSSSVLALITRRPLFITQVSSATLPWLSHAVGVVLLLSSCMVRVGGDVTASSCAAQLFLDVLGFSLVGLSVLGVVMLLRKRLSKTLFSMPVYQKRLLYKMAVLLAINLVIILLFPFAISSSPRGVQVVQRSVTLDTGVETLYSTCSYGDSKSATPLLVTLAIFNGLWLLYALLSCTFMVLKLHLQASEASWAAGEATGGPRAGAEAVNGTAARKARSNARMHMQLSATLLATTAVHCILFAVYLLVTYLPSQQHQATSSLVLQQVETVVIGVVVSVLCLYGLSALSAINNTLRMRRIGQRRSQSMSEASKSPPLAARAIATLPSQPSHEGSAARSSKVAWDGEGTKPARSTRSASIAEEDEGNSQYDVPSTNRNSVYSTTVNSGADVYQYEFAFDDSSRNRHRSSALAMVDGQTADHSTLQGCLSNPISAVCLLAFSRTTFDEENVQFIQEARSLLRDLSLPATGSMSLRAALHPGKKAKDKEKRAEAERGIIGSDAAEGGSAAAGSAGNVRSAAWYISETQRLYKQYVEDNSPKQINISGRERQVSAERMKAFMALAAQEGGPGSRLSATASAAAAGPGAAARHETLTAVQRAIDTAGHTRGSLSLSQPTSVADEAVDGESNLQHEQPAAVRETVTSPSVPNRGMKATGSIGSSDSTVLRSTAGLVASSPPLRSSFLSTSADSSGSLQLRFAIACLLQPCVKEVMTLVDTNTWPRFLSSPQAATCNRLMQWAHKFSDFSMEHRRAIEQRFKDENSAQDDELDAPAN